MPNTILIPIGLPKDQKNRSGAGGITRNYIKIVYSPPGDSDQAALAISLIPPGAQAISAPGLRSSMGQNADGDNIKMDRLSTSGNFASGERAGTILFTIDANGDATFEGLTLNKTAIFDEEYDNGDSGASATIDWTVGNKQKITLTAGCTLTFTAPGGACHLMLKLIQDATGGRSVTWPASVKWIAGSAPTITPDASAVDLVAFYCDGTNYYGTFGGDFQ